MKILILKPSALGDVVQALPVARLLKLHWPSAEIHWWVAAPFASLLEGDPDLAAVHRFHRHGWAGGSYWRNLFATLRTLRQRQFDLVIDLQSLARSALFAWAANGAFTIGLEDSREGAPALHDRSVPRPSYHTHAVDWYLQVLRALAVPVDRPFDWLPRNSQAAAQIAARWPTAGRRWLLLNPGARWLNKRWPAASFAAAARLLAEDPSLGLAILGGADDQPLAAEIIAHLPPGRAIDLTGRTTLPELVEWIRLGSLLITNDTGPMHIAAALGVPVLGLFGPTTPARTGPYGQLHRVQQTNLDCVPCMKPTCRNADPLACLKAIRPEEVARQARALMAV